MNTEAIIRQAVRNTINYVGCTVPAGCSWEVTDFPWDFQKNPTDAEVFENRVMYHFNAIKIKLAEDALREKIIPVDMNEVEDSYANGLESGQNWKWDHLPGGPWKYSAGEYEQDKYKALAAQLQAEHDAWMQGWWDGAANNPNCVKFKRPSYI